MDPEVSVAELWCFLTAVEKQTPEGGLSISDLEKLGGFPASSTPSRYIQALGERDRKKQEGKGLVSSKEDIDNRRKKIIRITPKGKRVISLINSLMSK